MIFESVLMLALVSVDSTFEAEPTYAMAARTAKRMRVNSRLRGEMEGQTHLEGYGCAP